MERGVEAGAIAGAGRRGARDLRECLLAQLPALCRLHARTRRSRGTRIVDHLEALARRDLAALERGLDASAEQVRAAYQVIRRLDPHPGWRFGQPDTRYIVPDVIVRKVKGKWVTNINPAVLPRVCLNRVYAELFQNNRTAAHAQLANQLQEARWLIRSSEQRFSTIQRVAESVVTKQRAYLEYGELAMKPLGLRHVAAELGLHESTVSRVTSNKYMATPRGLIEFRRFFSRELKTDTGGTCSATAIRALIKELIGAEEPGLPLSDAQLAHILGRPGHQGSSAHGDQVQTAAAAAVGGNAAAGAGLRLRPATGRNGRVRATSCRGFSGMMPQKPPSARRRFHCRHNG